MIIKIKALTSFAVAQTTPVFSGDRFTLACPGDTVQYSCYEALDTPITWGFLCANKPRQSPGYRFSIQMARTKHYNCSSDNEVRPSFSFTFSYASNASGTWSDLSVTLLDTNYSLDSSFWLRIDCRDPENAKYLNATGIGQGTGVNIASNNGFEFIAIPPLSMG